MLLRGYHMPMCLPVFEMGLIPPSQRCGSMGRICSSRSLEMSSQARLIGSDESSADRRLGLLDLRRWMPAHGSKRGDGEARGDCSVWLKGYMCMMLTCFSEVDDDRCMHPIIMSGKRKRWRVGVTPSSVRRLTTVLSL